MIKVRSFQLEELHAHRFSVYRMNKNVQTVYAYHIGNTMIDTGQSNSRDEVLQCFSNYKVDRIVLTHFHEDHTGNAGYLKRKWNVPVYAHPDSVKILKNGYKISPIGMLLSGSVDRVKTIPLYEDRIIDTGVCTLQPIFTPGHSHDHYSYYVKEKGWMFSGDLYVADKIKYFADFESVKEQIKSLRRLLSFDFDVLLCSHNPKISNGRNHLSVKLHDLEEFYGKVVELNAKGYDLQQILKETGRKENKMYSILTLGSFSAMNMVKSVLRDENFYF